MHSSGYLVGDVTTIHTNLRLRKFLFFIFTIGMDIILQTHQIYSYRNVSLWIFSALCSFGSLVDEWIHNTHTHTHIHTHTHTHCLLSLSTVIVMCIFVDI